jgi:hypothetical protein
MLQKAGNNTLPGPGTALNLLHTRIMAGKIRKEPSWRFIEPDKALMHLHQIQKIPPLMNRENLVVRVRQQVGLLIKLIAKIMLITHVKNLKGLANSYLKNIDKNGNFFHLNGN